MKHQAAIMASLPVGAVRSSLKEQWKGSTTIYVLEETTALLIKSAEKIAQHVALESAVRPAWSLEVESLRNSIKSEL